MSKIRQFILDNIQTEYTIPAETDIETLNYVEEGYVDSMAMMRFVIELEDEFGIEFTDEELEDPAFKLVGALEKMIENKMGENK